MDLIRRICEAIEIQVHTPKSVSIPYATAAVQFENGKVLVTGGDEEILAAICDIVDPENVEITRIPIVQYPLFGGAGLHCLITENPLPLVSM